MSSLTKWVVCWCGVLVLFGAGCGKSTPQGAGNATAPAEQGTVDEATRKASGGDKPIIPINREVKSFEGNWVIMGTIQKRDYFLWIVRFTPGADGKLRGEIISSAKEEFQPKVAETVIEDKSVRLVIKNSQVSMDFQGTFNGVGIRGTLAGGQADIIAARMFSTNATKLSDYIESALPPATDVFDQAIRSMPQRPDPDEIVRLASENRTSPMSLDVLSTLLVMQSQFPFTDEQIQKLTDEYLECAKVWGPRMVMKAELQCGEQLIAAKRHPRRALQHLQTAEKLMGDEFPAGKKRLEMFRETGEIQVSIEKIRSESEADRAAAYVELQQAAKRQQYNPEILSALATHAEATKQSDVAIEYLSDIVALPLLESILREQRAGQPAGDPTPSETLKKLWIERHGSDEKLTEHLTEWHRRRIDSLLEVVRTKAPAPPASDAGDHVVLVEFFTGGQCAPCIATDLAMTALGQTYPHTEVVTLRYHQHVPGPDGLVNQDGEDRFAFYEGAGTPTVTVDGVVFNPNQVPIAGPMQFAETSYGILRQVIDAHLLKKTPIRLQLEARVENGELSLRADVNDVPEELLPSLRLRLALVEEALDAPMPNGILRHEMIVREMPGGARGLAAKRGELKYSYTMPYSDLQKHLDEYIQRFEAGNKLEFPVEMKPKVKGRLFLVGWVQNDKLSPLNEKANIPADKVDQTNSAKFVLQTALVPVTGDLPVASPSASASSDATKPSSPSNDSARPPEPALPE